MSKGFRLLLLLLLISLRLSAQIDLTFQDARKSVYAPGETAVIQLTVKAKPETCSDGMKQTRIFCAGLRIEDQSKWRKIAPGVFCKQLTVKFLEKKIAKLTVLRKTDKEHLFKQETFELSPSNLNSGSALPAAYNEVNAFTVFFSKMEESPLILAWNL